MIKWFRSECDEIVKLKNELKTSETLTKLYKEMADQYQEYYTHNLQTISRLNDKCEMYDKVMTGLRINVNLNEKKK